MESNATIVRSESDITQHSSWEPFDAAWMFGCRRILYVHHIVQARTRRRISTPAAAISALSWCPDGIAAY